MSKQNVPELRFPEFSGEWEDDLFGSIVSNKSEKNAPNENEEVIDIELDSIESNTGRLLHTYDSRTQKSQKNRFNEGDVLYSKLRPYLNKFYWPDFPGVCTSEIWVFSSKNDDKLKNQFIYYFIQTSRFGNMANKSAGSKMPRADWKLVENIKFSYPKVEEQHKISDLLIKLDRLIELEVKKLELLEEQKKGYMQKIFSQELRFKDENGNDYPEWEKKNLKEISDINTGKSKVVNQVNGKYANLGSTGVLGMAKTYDYEGDFILTARVGHYAGKLYKYSGKVNISDNTIYIRTDINNDFIFENLNSINLQKLVYGSGQPLIKSSDLKKLTIMVPVSVKEMEKIGSLFTQSNYKIRLQKKKIKQLNRRKKGLLQKVLI